MLMYIFMIFLSILNYTSSEEIPKQYLYKIIKSTEKPLFTPGEIDQHSSIGSTYQSITKRKYNGTPSSSTTAEILNTVTSPHSSASVSFRKTSVDHNENDEHEQENDQIDTNIYKNGDTHVQSQHLTSEHAQNLFKPKQYYDLQNYIVNDPNQIITENQIPFLPKTYLTNTSQVSPKAFSYQPVYTVLNNIKSFYKVPKYTEFVKPQKNNPYIQNLDIYSPNNYKYINSQDIIKYQNLIQNQIPYTSNIVYADRIPDRFYPQSTPKVIYSDSTPNGIYSQSFPNGIYLPSTQKITYEESTPKINFQDSTSNINYPQSTPNIIYKESTPKIIYQDSSPKISQPSPKHIKLFTTNLVSYNVSVPNIKTEQEIVSQLNKPLITPASENIQGVTKTYNGNSYFEPDRSFLFKPVVLVKKY